MRRICAAIAFLLAAGPGCGPTTSQGTSAPGAPEPASSASPAGRPETASSRIPGEPGQDGIFRALPLAMSPEVVACEREWLLADEASDEVTRRCIDTYLVFAYGAAPDAEALSLDPTYGSPIEVRYTARQLVRMAGLARAACPPPEAGLVSACERAVEFFEGMAARKVSLFEDVNVEGIGPALIKILDGERLDEFDLWLQHEQLGFSLLNLGKLEAAVQARHGRPWRDEDLRAFLYEARADEWETLDLPRLEPDPAFETSMLTQTDLANLALIARARDHELGRTVDGSWCHEGEAVVFSCDLEDGQGRVSLCGGEGEDGALAWVVLRRGEEGPDERAPWIHEPVAEAARYGQAAGRVSVEVMGDLGVYRIERTVGLAGAPAIAATLPFRGEPRVSSCAEVMVDELERVGAAMDRAKWVDE